MNKTLWNYGMLCKMNGAKSNVAFPRVAKHLGANPSDKELDKYFLGKHNELHSLNGEGGSYAAPYLIKAIDSDGTIHTEIHPDYISLSGMPKENIYSLEQIKKFNELLEGNPLKNLRTGDYLILHGERMPVRCVPEVETVREQLPSNLECLTEKESSYLETSL